MSTWPEAIAWMKENVYHRAANNLEPQYEYELREMKLYRRENGNHKPWLPHIPSTDIITSATWDLLEPF